MYCIHRYSSLCTKVHQVDFFRLVERGEQQIYDDVVSSVEKL